MWILSIFREEAINLKSNWNESLANVAAVKKAKAEKKQQQGDLFMTKRASIMVTEKKPNYYYLLC